MEFDLGTG